MLRRDRMHSRRRHFLPDPDRPQPRERLAAGHPDRASPAPDGDLERHDHGHQLHGGTRSRSNGGSPEGTNLPRRSTITFTAATAGSNVVFAWGGHVASYIDWGEGDSAAGITGSPYHMRLVSLNGGGGNQDRSISVSDPGGSPADHDTGERVTVTSRRFGDRHGNVHAEHRQPRTERDGQVLRLRPRHDGSELHVGRHSGRQRRPVHEPDIRDVCPVLADRSRPLLLPGGVHAGDGSPYSPGLHTNQ